MPNLQAFQPTETHHKGDKFKDALGWRYEIVGVSTWLGGRLWYPVKVWTKAGDVWQALSDWHLDQLEPL